MMEFLGFMLLFIVGAAVVGIGLWWFVAQAYKIGGGE